MGGEKEMSDDAQIISRAQAKALGLIRYRTGRPCKHGHVAERTVSSGACRDCDQIRQKSTKGRNSSLAYREANKQMISTRGKSHYEANSAIYKERAMKRYAEKRKEISQQMRVYAAENKDRLKVYIRDYMRERRATDEQFRLRMCLRNLLWRSIKASGKKFSGRTEEVLGYSPAELKRHIEALFSKGMTWENHGEWHIDHRRPLATFDLSTIDGIRLANSLHNLQPLWAEKNLKKSAKWSGQLTLV